MNRPDPEPEEFDAALRRARYVEDPCEKCAGVGGRNYSHGATWRGGMGAACLAWDVCDVCWGSGDRWRRWTDLRVLRDEEEQRVAKRAAEYLADPMYPRACMREIMEIVAHLDKLIDKRGAPATMMLPAIACALRNKLARGINMPERKDIR